MTRGEAWLFHASNALVAASGLAYAWAAYLAEPEDPYAIVNHPLQPDLQHLHVLVAPLLVFAGGVVWRSHVAAKLRGNGTTRRTSGWTLLVALAPCAMSGYAIQVATEDSWRFAFVAVHLVTSALWIAGSLVHVLARRSERAAAQDAPLPSSTRG
jgi:hypothetical protein